MIRSLIITGCLCGLATFASIAQPPALLPLPKEMSLKSGYINLNTISGIRTTDSSLKKTAAEIKEFLQLNGNTIHTGKSTTALPEIKLSIRKPLKNIESAEGYHLLINSKGIELAAISETGIYYGWQTLKQLLQKNNSWQWTEIYDQPAFPWRGFMVDVGRNYQTMELLKAQIDRMAAYKLNTFHFHATEDIAWRLEVPGFPSLTADSTMLRDAGMYYSVEEVKEIMNYCADRSIRFILEVDMPGHSAAFERAMGVSMQSDKGMELVKEILRQVVKTYSPEYLHIGGDEVKITNRDFLPAMTKLLDSMEVKHLGWSPGGNIPANTIRQLWMTDAPIEKDKEHIDSRHLYLNHMDPLEAVVTIFHRQIGKRSTADQNMLGGIICVWNDRRLVNENYHLLLNGVYPAMLAFAERSWKGGGQEKWTSVIGAKGSEAYNSFADFEKRLLEHKTRYFQQETFPYSAQSYLEWELFGPFDNEGDIHRNFEITKPSLKAIGGTIVLRHWWAPAITGHLPDPKERTTWYARTRIYAEEAGWKNCRIGFSNFSRSMITRAPLSGWDERGSMIWFNGNLITAPNWKRSGKQISLETPITDEDYYYRAPTKLYFKKGWNEVLIKVPVNNFNGSDWQNPVKWMFTFFPED